MNFRRIAIPFIIGSLVLLSSCEYPLDQVNFRKISKPDSIHPFDLSLVSEKDTIKVFNTTQFSYNINTYGLGINEADFSIGNKTWAESTPTGNFTITPSDYKAGYNPMYLVLYSHTGTGSLADQTGAEVYKVSKQWMFLIDGRAAPNVTPVKSITKDGYLKVSWPKCTNYNFSAYELNADLNNRSFTKLIPSANTLEYIDSSYIGGSFYFNVRVLVLSDGLSSQGNPLSVFDSLPSLKFTNLGMDSLRISWNKSKYKAKYTLVRVDTDSTLLYFSMDTSYTIHNADISKSIQLMFYITPARLNTYNTYDTRYDHEIWAISRRVYVNSTNLSYNQLDNTIYTDDYNQIHGYDLSSQGIVRTLYFPVAIGMHSCAVNSKKLAVLSNDSIYVYDDKNSTKPVTIPYGSNFRTYDHFRLTDNDLIFTANYKRLDIISIPLRKVIASLNLDDYPVYSSWACFSTSRDSKYFCMVTKNGISLYNIENGIISKIYTDTRVYRSVLFDENNPGLLYLSFYGSTDLEVRNAADFSLANTISLPGAAEVIRNIDPISGYMLLTDYTNVYVMDLIQSKMIFKITCGDYRPVLYGNNIFMVNGYSFDISKYLKK